MKMSFVHIRKLVGYKKGTIYTAYYHNGNGGGFSNSGKQKSFNRILEYVRCLYGLNVKIRTFEENVFTNTRVFLKDQSNF